MAGLLGTRMLEIDLGCAVLRELTLSDAPSLARHANDRRIWLQLRDVFPHPYQEEDARKFIERIRLQNQPTAFALAVDGHAVGVIGLILQYDISTSFSTTRASSATRSRISTKGSLTEDMCYWCGARFSPQRHTALDLGAVHL